MDPLADTAYTGRLTVRDLFLDSIAEQAAKKLLYMYPNYIVFLSGRRDRLHQAYAMAGSVHSNRRYVEDTYAPSRASRQCQEWVDKHSEAATVGDIMMGLFGVLKLCSDQDFGLLTRHSDGSAFDIQPVNGDKGIEIQNFIKTLLGLRKFLTHEGGLMRWHLEFDHSSGMENV